MEKKLYGIAKESIEETCTHSTRLEYYLIETKINLDGESMCTYGVEIKKILPNLDSNILEESDMVKEVWIDKSNAENFINLLIDCRVSPIHLRDIIDDFMGDEINKNISLKTA